MQELEPPDIYRGEPPSPPSRPGSSVASSSSSSGWSVLGLRRGTLGGILEMAINRWARARSDSSSIASSTTSLRARMPRRRGRASSVATSHNTNTENIIRARRKAWQQGRVLPREFVLFLPEMFAPQAANNGPDNSTQDRRVFRSVTLPPVLSQLDSAIKRSTRPRKKEPKITPSGRALEKQNIDTILHPSVHTFQGGMPGNHKNNSGENHQIHRHIGRTVPEKSPRRPAW